MKLMHFITRKSGRAAAARRRRAIERMRANAPLMRQHEASRASFARGEPAIPGPQVRAEAAERGQRGRL